MFYKPEFRRAWLSFADKVTSKAVAVFALRNLPALPLSNLSPAPRKALRSAEIA
jgi:hypothetical protein